METQKYFAIFIDIIAGDPENKAVEQKSLRREPFWIITLKTLTP
jgi:hypothetical protein